MEMLGRMFVFRRIAAAYVSAFQAETQVDPCVSDFDAVFTEMFVRTGQLHVIEMSALSHNCLRILVAEAGNQRRLPFRQRTVDQRQFLCGGPENMVPPLGIEPYNR
jgi:hypothetical protein